MLCFSNESEGSKFNDIQTPKPYIREFRVPNLFKYTKIKTANKRKKEDNEV